MDLNLHIFPWDDENAKPFFINDEGFEWWVDKSMTEWCSRYFNDNPPLDAVVFYIRKDGEYLTRMLVDKKTNEPLYESGNMETMAYRIDALRFAQATENENSK